MNTRGSTASEDSSRTMRPGLWARLARVARHLWMDQDDANRALPPDLVERLRRRVAASESRHSGEVCMHVEAGLPWSYLRRQASPRQRAVTLFGKLRVWDTRLNNGVLIYLLLADRAIEIVADRGLNEVVSQAQWQDIAQRLGGQLKAGRVEDGLTQALEEITALLVEHFPLSDQERNPNELPDEPSIG